MQLVARMIHKGNEIKCGDFCVCFFKQRIINHQERYSFRATSCTLRSTINPRTERYLTLFRHFRFRATSCTLRFPISCIKMHATIYDFVQQVARYDPRFRATSCTLRFMISCNELHATGIILDINFVF